MQQVWKNTQNILLTFETLLLRNLPLLLLVSRSRKRVAFVAVSFPSIGLHKRDHTAPLLQTEDGGD